TGCGSSRACADYPWIGTEVDSRGIATFPGLASPHLRLADADDGRHQLRVAGRGRTHGGRAPSASMDALRGARPLERPGRALRHQRAGLCAPAVDAFAGARRLRCDGDELALGLR